MPEGPETHRMADNIRKSLKKKEILSFRFQHESLTPLTRLKEILIIDVFSLGKAIIIRIQGGISIISHNQLYGKWTFNRPKTILKNNNMDGNVPMLNSSKLNTVALSNNSFIGSVQNIFPLDRYPFLNL